MRLDLRCEVLSRDGYMCRICLLPIRPRTEHVDHIVPVSMGGSDEIVNLRITHAFCNVSRGPHRGGILHPDAHVRRMHLVGIHLKQARVLRGLP
jgi:5-methylcytosine-specific restriction endonuclease McrA